MFRLIIDVHVKPVDRPRKLLIPLTGLFHFMTEPTLLGSRNLTNI